MVGRMKERTRSNARPERWAGSVAGSRMMLLETTRAAPASARPEPRPDSCPLRSRSRRAGARLPHPRAAPRDVDRGRPALALGAGAEQVVRELCSGARILPLAEDETVGA